MPTTQRTVVIDPGHGGSAQAGGSSPNNAIGQNGLLEKDLTLDIGRRVAALLTGTANVILTRTGDENLPLGDRARIARDADADVFLSIHLNGWRDGTVDGSEAWVARDASPASRRLARAVLDRVVTVTHARDRGVREENFGVLVSARHAANTAATLVELAFLTNADEATRLARDDYRQSLAQAIADGITALPAAAAQASALAGGPARIDGIHPSGWNPKTPGALDLRLDHIEFSIPKVTQGTGFVEPLFAGWRDDARAHNFPIGSFHFMTASGALADAADLFRDQANNMAGALGRLLPGDLPPTFDFEEEGGGAGSVPWRGVQWLDPMSAFLDRIETALGRVPMIYTSPRVWREFIQDRPEFARFGDYPLWVVRIPPGVSQRDLADHRLTDEPELPAPWSTWAIWQYAGDFTPDEFPVLQAAEPTSDMDVSNGGIHFVRGLADLGRPAPHGADARLVAFADESGELKLLTFSGSWVEESLTTLARQPGSFPGPMAVGDVAACEIDGRQFYAFRNQDDGHLCEIERNGQQVTLRDLTADVVNAGTGADPFYLRPVSDPTYVVNGSERVLVYWADHDHQLLLQTRAGAWQLPPIDVTASAGIANASGNATPFVAGGTIHVVGRAGGDGHLVDVFHDGAAWQGSDLTHAEGAAAATYQPTLLMAGDGTPRIVYRALRGEIHQLDLNGHDEALLRGAPACAGNPAAFLLSGVPHVVYRGPEGQLHELVGDGAGGFTHEYLPCSGAAADPGVAVGTINGQATALLVFRGLDGDLHEARRTADLWTCQTIQAVPAQGASGLSLETRALDAPPTPVVTVADSSEVDQVVAADDCGVGKKSDGSYRERTPDAIVIHVLLANYADVISKWSAGGDCTPPHYVIRNDGEITQLVAEKYMAQHAGPQGNPTMIGIEHDGWDSEPRYFTEEMYLWSAALVREICARRNIPVDRAHIIGHDEVQGTTHGDPGGYWDWDYYMALVRWDGSTAANKPLRAVIDTTGMPVPAGWNEEDRDSGNATWRKVRDEQGPYPRNSYGARYLWANGAADADPNDFVEFHFTVPDGGVWGVSGWWPVLGNANKGTRIEFTTTSDDPTQQTASNIMDQSELWLRSRQTVALGHSPTWCPLPAFQLKQNDVITARVLRRSDHAGRVFADAFRFLKT
jgi:N-acetylmuramoyl-L-alanine amidase/GH25 family lysozyme M1 (1,4-beta-N-acetylmuramidase)